MRHESSRFGTLTFNMSHASNDAAARPREKKSLRDSSRIAGVEKFVGSRFTPTCNTSCVCPVRRTRTPFGLFNPFLWAGARSRYLASDPL